MPGYIPTRSSSSKYPIPPPKESVGSTIIRERSDAPMQPLPEKRQHYDPWAVGREHDAKMGVEATGDEMLPFAVAGAVPAATRLLPAAGRGAYQLATQGAAQGAKYVAPVTEAARRGYNKYGTEVQRQVGNVLNLTNKISKSKPMKAVSSGPFSKTQGVPGQIKAPIKIAEMAAKGHLKGPAGVVQDAAHSLYDKSAGMYDTLADSISRK